MRRYQCVRCQAIAEMPFCPQCNQFLTDDVAVAESVLRPLSAPLAPIEWCTAFGHWGDVFCCVGVMKRLLDLRGQTRTNVLYVGPDMDIVEWMKQQPFIDRIAAIKSTREGYNEFWLTTTRVGTVPDDWLNLLAIPRMHPASDAFPRCEQFTQTHVNKAWFDPKLAFPAQIWHDGVLPQSAYATAASVLPLRTGKLYHLHPMSTWSEVAGNHWGHWLAAIEWLVEKTPHTYVLTGLEPLPYLPDHPRLINLIGKLRGNMDVLALSSYCDGLISTPNNVAIWSAIVGQKALVVGNAATGNLTSYYRRFIQRSECSTYLNVNATLSQFQQAACEFFEG